MSQYQHGTAGCYKHKPCRCVPCTAANTLAQNQYRAGVVKKDLVLARESRKHARWLCSSVPGTNRTGPGAANYRWTYRTLSEHIGMNYRSFSRFMVGERKKILRTYADRILATPDRKFFLELEKRKSLDRYKSVSHNRSSRPVGVTG